MQRCIDVATLGMGNTAPNPMVGAVLVYSNRVIGEGFHEYYGGPHAEVNCINSVVEADKMLIEKSTLYVSLEPCAHFGKTPPCADLIIRYRIPEVIIGCRDSFEKVNGSGIEKLKAAGIRVETGILEKECRRLNSRFFTFHEKKRPYIILKWAASSDGKISAKAGAPLSISNSFTNRLVHKWRTEEAAILVGINTVLKDDPLLTSRYWKGKNPVRILLDERLAAPQTSRIFNGESKTIILNESVEKSAGRNAFHRVKKDLLSILDFLYQQEISSVLVEGGAKTLQRFIDGNCWDEVRIITNTDLRLEEGTDAPVFSTDISPAEQMIFSDRIRIYLNR